MGTIRMVGDVVIRDIEGARTLLQRMAHHAAAFEPRILAWDYSFDEAGKRMFWVQEHASEQALLAYEADLHDRDFGLRLDEVLDFERLVVLGPVTDPGLMTFFETFPSLQLFPHTYRSLPSDGQAQG